MTNLEKLFAFFEAENQRDWDIYLSNFFRRVCRLGAAWRIPRNHSGKRSLPPQDTGGLSEQFRTVLLPILSQQCRAKSDSNNFGQ